MAKNTFKKLENVISGKLSLKSNIGILFNECKDTLSSIDISKDLIESTFSSNNRNIRHSLKSKEIKTETILPRSIIDDIKDSYETEDFQLSVQLDPDETSVNLICPLKNVNYVDSTVVEFVKTEEISIKYSSFQNIIIQPIDDIVDENDIKQFMAQIYKQPNDATVMNVEHLENISIDLYWPNSRFYLNENLKFNLFTDYGAYGRMWDWHTKYENSESANLNTNTVWPYNLYKYIGSDETSYLSNVDWYVIDMEYVDNGPTDLTTWILFNADYTSFENLFDFDGTISYTKEDFYINRQLNKPPWYYEYEISDDHALVNFSNNYDEFDFTFLNIQDVIQLDNFRNDEYGGARYNGLFFEFSGYNEQVTI